MLVHVFRRPCPTNEPYRLFLMSDLHIGHVACKKRLIAQELEAARSRGARVLINGDVFDAINPKDKRFALSQIDPSIRGRDDQAEAVVRLAETLLGPYADLIDFVGVGNHEEAWLRRGASELVTRLIERLNSRLGESGAAHRIRHGGIAGFVRTYLITDKPGTAPTQGGAPRTVSHTLCYHHGSGGDAPVTKGQIEFSRKVAAVVCDAYWMGHKHNKTFTEDCILDLSARNLIRYRKRLSIQTASYLENWRRTDQSDPLGYTYAESANAPPKPLGGLWLTLTPRSESSRATGRRVTRDWVEQTVHTGPAA